MLPDLGHLALHAEAVPTGMLPRPSPKIVKGPRSHQVAKKNLRQPSVAPKAKVYELPNVTLRDETPVPACDGDPKCAHLKIAGATVRESIAKLFANTDPTLLGAGVDNTSGVVYDTLSPVDVFEIVYGPEHVQARAYSERRNAMKQADKPCKAYGSGTECTRTDKAMSSIRAVGGMGPLSDEVNEKYLLHGAEVNALVSIIQTRFKPEMSRDMRQLIGPGVYQAEDAAKADQYASTVGTAVIDEALAVGTHGMTRFQQNDDLVRDLPTYYMIVTRTLLGCANHVGDGQKGTLPEDQMDMRGEPTLQLGDDPNTGGQTLLLNPRYDSLVKEHYNVFRGSYRSGSRFREFLVQRSDQISTGLGWHDIAPDTL